MLAKSQALKAQILNQVKNVYTIAIFDNRVQWNTGKPRFRQARVVTTANYKRYREYIRLAIKGRFNFVVYENVAVNGKNISTKITPYQPENDYEENSVKVNLAS